MTTCIEPARRGAGVTGRVTPEHTRAQEEFRTFARTEIVPYADQWDQEERIPRKLIDKLARAGYLAAAVPAECVDRPMEASALGDDQLPMDGITLGLLHEAIGYGCSSVRSVLTVHTMVASAIHRWGSDEQKERWLPRLASGACVAAFALTEAGAGTDARQLETTATIDGDTYVLTGSKKWITYGQGADLFLVFARCNKGVAAFLVERDSDGLATTRISGLLGARASMLAELELTDCRVPASALVGRVGFGLDAVAASALDIGRYCVAWGSVGLAQACLDESIRYSQEREQFGKHLCEHQLVQRLLTEMVTKVMAARLLCLHAGHLKDIGDLQTIPATCVAKYFASTSAFEVAAAAVQIHGASGCHASTPVARLLRDAKIGEIIEGSTEMQQVMIANAACHGHLA